MKLLKEITKHEVIKRWAIGEVYSEFFNTSYKKDKEETLALLTSNHINEEVEGINRVLESKRDLVSSLPLDAKWYCATLEINKFEMNSIYVLDVPGWARNSKGTYLLSDAAINIKENPSLDRRVTDILNALRSKSIQMKGITLLANNVSGPYLTIEGNGRLTGIYILQLLERSKLFVNNEIEITIGIHNEINKRNH